MVLVVKTRQYESMYTLFFPTCRECWEKYTRCLLIGKILMKFLAVRVSYFLFLTDIYYDFLAVTVAINSHEAG